MLAPLLISYKYENTSPKIVNSIAKKELIIIIVDNLLAKTSATNVGIVKRAITKIKPTALIAATTHRDTSIKMSSSCN